MHWESPRQAPHTCQVPILVEFSVRKGSLGSLGTTSRSSRCPSALTFGVADCVAMLLQTQNITLVPAGVHVGFVVVRLLPEKDKLAAFWNLDHSFSSESRTWRFSRQTKVLIKTRQSTHNFRSFFVFSGHSIYGGNAKNRPCFRVSKVSRVVSNHFPKVSDSLEVIPD